MYESNRIALAIDGNTEQLLHERMIQSVRVIEYWKVRELHSTLRHSMFTTEHVSKIFRVGVTTAQDILTVMIQKGCTSLCHAAELAVPY
jgi:hypothetical protein